MFFMLQDIGKKNMKVCEYFRLVWLSCECFVRLAPGEEETI